MGNEHFEKIQQVRGRILEYTIAVEEAVEHFILFYFAGEDTNKMLILKYGIIKKSDYIFSRKKELLKFILDYTFHFFDDPIIWRKENHKEKNENLTLIGCIDKVQIIRNRAAHSPADRSDISKKSNKVIFFDRILKDNREDFKPIDITENIADECEQLCNIIVNKLNEYVRDGKPKPPTERQLKAKKDSLEAKMGK